MSDIDWTDPDIWPTFQTYDEIFVRLAYKDGRIDREEAKRALEKLRDNPGY
ncbi:hypothetical protein ABZ470_39955 [Streptosporangium sp. NPDC020072]|uniref:hypothetical protein n=1 Tax=Streptosporangium sp. NPDC020072 TaxID=3154788 RepID=UPI00342CCA56